MKKISLLIVCIGVISIETFAGVYQTSHKASKPQDVEKSKITVAAPVVPALQNPASGASSAKSATSNPATTDEKPATQADQGVKSKQEITGQPKK